MNEEAYKDLVLSINTTVKQGRVMFSLVQNRKTTQYPEGNYKLACDRLTTKYAPKIAPSLLKSKKKFAHSILGDSEGIQMSSSRDLKVCNVTWKVFTSQ